MIDIFGSKNLLEIVKRIYGADKIGKTVISSSLESQFASSIAPSFSKLEKYTDNQREIIDSDFRKSFRSQYESDILIVDLLGERNGIGIYQNSKITLNNEVKTYLENEKIKSMMLENRIKLIPGLIESFETAAKNYKNVVICELYLTNYYLDQDNIIKMNPNQYSINKVNALLKTFYDHMKFQNDNFTFIQFDNLYSKTEGNMKVNPWIYSQFSQTHIEKKLSEALNQ